MTEAREPEVRELRQHGALVRNPVRHDHVEGRDAVGRDHQQAITEIEGVAHLPAPKDWHTRQLYPQQRLMAHRWSILSFTQRHSGAETGDAPNGEDTNDE